MTDRTTAESREQVQRWICKNLSAGLFLSALLCWLSYKVKVVLMIWSSGTGRIGDWAGPRGYVRKDSSKVVFQIIR